MDSAERPMFHIIDYVVFAVTITLSIGIGLIFAFTGRKQSTNNEYLMGDRKMKLIPVAISLLVSYLSTIGILGNPAEVYAYGTQFMLYIIALIAGVLLGTFTFVPLYYPLKITSVFEYQQMRFGVRYVELFAILLTVLCFVLFNAVLIFSPCMAFEAVSGFPSWASILISGFATILYTTLGGMKAVVWTDCFQAVVIFAGLLAIVIKGTMDVGGIGEVWKINDDWGRVKFFDFSFDPTERLTFWSVVVFNTFLWMSIATAQPSVQRFMALPTMKKAKMSSLFLIPGFLLSGLLTCSCGVTAFAYYAKKGCDPMMSGKIKGPNMILPYFVMDVLTIPSLPGLFIACLFSASLSSVSSTYSALGAIVWQGLLQQKYGHLPPEKQTNITKLTTLVSGVICIGTAFLIMQLGGTLIQVTYSVIGGIGGPLVGLGLVAGLFPKAGPRGILTGSILAVAFCTWLSFGATFSGVYAPPLPAPVYNCTVPGSMTGLLPDLAEGNNTSNLTLGLDLSNISLSKDLGQSHLEMMKKGSEGSSHSMGHGKSGLQWMYSISYFYYPIIGMISVFVVSLIFSLIPKLEVKQNTPKKLLFPCVRPCCGIKDEDVKDTKSEDEGLEMENNKLPESKGEQDVWLLRNDVQIDNLRNPKINEENGNLLSKNEAKLTTPKTPKKTRDTIDNEENDLLLPANIRLGSLKNFDINDPTPKSPKGKKYDVLPQKQNTPKTSRTERVNIWLQSSDPHPPTPKAPRVDQGASSASKSPVTPKSPRMQIQNVWPSTNSDNTSEPPPYHSLKFPEYQENVGLSLGNAKSDKTPESSRTEDDNIWNSQNVTNQQRPSPTAVPHDDNVWVMR